jgi:DNA-binding CsgD family transcriptional regulator
MNAIIKLFTQSTDAVFGIDKTKCVQFCNERFESLLGYPRGEVVGKKWCAELLCGTSLYNKPFCGKSCTISKHSSDNSNMSDVDLIVKRADGDHILVNIGIHYAPEGNKKKTGDVLIFFSLRRVNSQRLLQRIASEHDQWSKGHEIDRYKLTPRELKILFLASKGLDTKEIAEQLHISTLTVRNHFKNIYPKLEVHSRVEAVSVAIRHNLIR